MSPVALPPAVPRLGRADLLARVAAAGHQLNRTTHPLIVVGIRGYYSSMGVAGVNDRGIYDDALFIDTPNVTAAFNGNTDPSVAKTGIASLVPGFYPAYHLGLHRGQYQALIQRKATVTVRRDGGVTETGWFGINIHRGSNNSTSSEGCQTIPPAQWPGFIGLIESEAKRCFGAKWKTATIGYVLLG